MDSELTEQIVVRVPRELHDAIKAEAGAAERTVAQQVRWLIRQHLTENGADHGR